jgi:hypothetical protein
VTRWDGKTTKVHPVTGEKVPDESAQVPEWRYVNPRQAEWPQAEFIVGNPPFIGSKRMRHALGDGYVDALQAVWPDVPESTDFVVRWWHKAALLTRSGDVQRFGLITSNSIRQAYVRRAVEPHLSGDNPLSLLMAIPDHPWVDSADGAAVRIAMTVAERGQHLGVLREVVSERDETSTGEDLVERLADRTGVIGADLRVGANVAGAKPLRSNLDLCSVGMKTIGAAFQIDEATAKALGLGTVPGLDAHIRPYLSGRDFTTRPRGIWVVDFFGLTAEEVRSRFPAAFQHLLTRAKPEREQNRNEAFQRLWWVIGHPRQQFRQAAAGLPRYIVTVETAKHRLFAFVPEVIAPDSTLVTVCSADALHLGVLSSQVHVDWVLATGGTLEDRPRYNKTLCFETFPFPELEATSAARISQLAEELDAFRKARQAAQESVTLTGMYNVLDKLRREEPLNAKDKALHEQALVGVLRTLHDELDAAVLEAYGWQDLGPVPWTNEEARQAWTERLLERLVDLNTRRASEEAQGTIRWLRPAFQDPTAPKGEPQAAIELVGGAPAPQADTEDDAEAPAPAAAPATRQPWPADLPAQMRAVAEALAASAQPLDEDALAARFTGRGPWKKRLPQILETLVVLGKAQREAGGRWRGA